MQSADKKNGGLSSQPIIVRKKKKVSGGHHGGSWKVAYADFVTAMMAFFLLLWLLGSVEQQARAEIASYFKRPLKAVFSDGPHTGGDRIQAGSQGSRKPGMLYPGGEDGDADSTEYEVFQRQFERELKKNAILKAFEDQFQIELVPEGIRLYILDRYDQPMFQNGSPILTGYAERLLREVAELLNMLPNRLIVSGHTDAAPFGNGRAGYSNWELSTDRANAARRALMAGGLADGKVVKIEGLAHTVLAKKDDPYDPINRRISILLLNRTAEREYLPESAE